MRVQCRAYAGDDDLAAMQRVLIAGRQVSPHGGYIHVGDLNWWHAYLLRRFRWDECAYVWESAGAVVGWSLFSPTYGAFDLAVSPDVRDAGALDAVLDWTIARMTEIARQEGHTAIRTMWVFDDDHAWQGRLASRGFDRAPDYCLCYHVHSLETIPAVHLPDGFTSGSLQPGDADARAAAHRAAFESTWMTAEAYRGVMDAPAYCRDLDTVIKAPDGRIAAFALGWLDGDNLAGEFEPVGTCPEFRGRGLGKAVVCAGLQQFKALGARYVIVYTEHDNRPARALYQAAGFQHKKTIYSYVKALCHA